MAFIDTVLKPWKYYRFTFTEATNHLRYVYVSEMRLYENNNATGTNLSIGATATSNGNYSTTTTPDKAIDNLPNTGWESSQATPTLSADPRTLTIILPTAKLVKSIQIECNTPSERPRAFTIDVSDDGVNWTGYGVYTKFFSNSDSETIKTINVGSYIGGKAALANGNRVTDIKVLETLDNGRLAELPANVVYETDTTNWIVLVKPSTSYYVIYSGPGGYRPMIDGPILSGE